MRKYAIIVGEVRTMKSNPNTKPVAYSRSTLLEPRAKVLEESLKSSTHPQVTSLPFLEKIGSVIGDRSWMKFPQEETERM